MREKKTGEYVFSIIVNSLALVFANTVPLWWRWTEGVILESWIRILWAVDIACAVQVLGNLLLAFHRPIKLQAAIEAVSAAAGALSVIVFYIVFPLDFSHVVGAWLNTILRVLLIVGIGGTILAFTISLARLLSRRMSV